MGALAGGATALGAGAWVWMRGHATPDLAPATAELWAARFDQPDGKALTLQSLRGRPLVVNFWAPWCAPCVKEMPDLDRFAQTYAAKGWQVVGLAVDQSAAVRAFLGKQPVSFPIGIAGLETLGLIRRLGNPNGGLPFSLALGPDGRVLQRKLGATDYAELAQWAEALPAGA
jgi:thiol-disulfide isomerase/thioredoxin